MVYFTIGTSYITQTHGIVIIASDYLYPKRYGKRFTTWIHSIPFGIEFYFFPKTFGQIS